MFTHDEYSPDGYAEREASDYAASLAFGEGWQELILPLESQRYVSESDVAGGEPELWEPRRWFPGGVAYRD